MASFSRSSKRKIKKSPRYYVTTLLLVSALVSWLFYVNERNAPFLDSSLLLYPDNAPVVSSMSTGNVTTEEATLLQEQRLASHKVPSLSCASLLHQVRANKELDPNRGKLYSRLTSISPHFYISVHNAQFDNVRFGLFEPYGFYYEKALTQAFIEILVSENKNARVLDVGGNIGWFALLSAALGAQVATFEPFVSNTLRMCESMCLNGWLHTGGSVCLQGSETTPFLAEKIRIFPYAVCDKQQTLYFHPQERNPGMGRVDRAKRPGSTVVRGVTLDQMAQALGWNDYGKIDILKVDVEGAEVGVFRGAQGLLKSNRVLNIFMEGNLRSEAEKRDFETIVKLLVESNYVVYKIGGFRGPDSTKAVPRMNGQFFENLLKSCGTEEGGGRKRGQCNLWWKAKT